MAIDSASKRKRALEAFWDGLPFPDSSIDATDRAWLLGGYYPGAEPEGMQTLTGAVRNVSGTATEGAVVRAAVVAVNNINTGKAITVTPTQTTTNASGQFSLTVLKSAPIRVTMSYNSKDFYDQRFITSVQEASNITSYIDAIATGGYQTLTGFVADLGLSNVQGATISASITGSNNTGSSDVFDNQVVSTLTTVSGAFQLTVAKGLRLRITGKYNSNIFYQNSILVTDDDTKDLSTYDT